VWAGRVARLSNCRSHHRCGCPVLRIGEKGGYDDGIHNGRCRTDKSCAGSIAAHPCKKRKDGAPSVGMMQCKDGPPAEDFVRLCVGKLRPVSCEKATLKLLRRLFLCQKHEACRYHADFRR
jgi:hypothetical protein